MGIKWLALSGWIAAIGALRLLSQVAIRDPEEIAQGFAWLIAGGGLVWLWRLARADAIAMARENIALAESTQAMSELSERAGQE